MIPVGVGIGIFVASLYVTRIDIFFLKIVAAVGSIKVCDDYKVRLGLYVQAYS